VDCGGGSTRFAASQHRSCGMSGGSSNMERLESVKVSPRLYLLSSNSYFSLNIYRLDMSLSRLDLKVILSGFSQNLDGFRMTLQLPYSSKVQYS